MSPVIKSADPGGAERVRPLRFHQRIDGHGGAVIDAEKARLRADLEQSTALLAKAEAEIERLHAEVERAAVEAEEQGRKAGLEAATDRQAERLDVLEKGVFAAVDRMSGELASLERLAPALAEAGLERLIRDPVHRSGLLRETVVANVRRLEADAIVRVDVAAADFPDIGELSETISTAAHRKVEVRHATDLRTGECRIRMVLGELEVGLDQQWDGLSSLLRDLAAPEPTP